MKNIISILLLIITIPLSVLSQKSDFDMVEDFKSDIQNLSYKIENIISSSQINTFHMEIEKTKKIYGKNKLMFDRALYPQNIEQTFTQLELSLLAVENRLVLIEHQREQLVSMRNRTASMKLEINRLYTITDTLKRKLSSAKKEVNTYVNELKGYNDLLIQRDSLVIRIIDSMLISYDKTVSIISDLKLKKPKLLNSDSPLEWIYTVLTQINATTDYNSSFLTVEDYLRMHSLQIRFNHAWKKMQAGLITVYGLNDDYLQLSIEHELKIWDDRSQKYMWSNIHKYLTNQDMILSTFSDADSFFESLENYIQESHRLTKQEFLSKKGYIQSKKVADFWNSTFKNEWLLYSNVFYSGETQNIERIDKSLSYWENDTQPIHPMFVSILSLALVSITGFIFLMIKTKEKR